ncbi:MAG TPA: hypothetical protein VFB52_07850, partial [Solirubrobacterales bacterium]|nr:hypothetical protein [Solirubrobacterales bacterium]
MATWTTSIESTKVDGTHTARGYAAAAPDAALAPHSFERRALGPHDVRIVILHCGVCHSDLHMARDEWG